MIRFTLISVFTMAAAMAATTAGCSDNAIDRAYDCDQICDKYKACADANYDDDACGERCRENAGNSEAFEDEADACQACVDDRSCVSAAFGCAAECASIVP